MSQQERLIETAAAPEVQRSPDDIKKYMELVAKCARNRLDHPIPNGSPAHARILIAKLFETARDNVCLLSGRLTDATETGEDVYGEENLIEQALRFLRRKGTRLRIILQSDALHKGADNRLLRKLVEDPRREGQIELYSGSELLKDVEMPHFMVTDALAYRFENDDTKTTAVANFGDADTAKTLRLYFRSVAEYLETNPAMDKNSIKRYAPGAVLAC